MNVHSEATNTDTAKRRLILEAALTLFSEEGFHGASMAKLAKTAGLPVGTIYRHFAGKEELIHALYSELKRDRLIAMLDGQSDGMSLRARFDLYWQNTFDYCLAHPREFKFAEAYAYSPFLRDSSKAMHTEVGKALATFFEEGYRSGTFKSLSPQLLLPLISGPLNALLARAVAGLLTLSQTDQQSVMDACWDAIKA
ncbi:MAG: TetR/AcrR family transcriptional regulator [Parvibaculaceae bacterium]